MSYFVNQRLGGDQQDVFRGYIVMQDLINERNKKVKCAIKKIRLSEIEKESEILAMKKTLESGQNDNVLRLNAVERTSEYLYLALELCEGSIADNNFFRSHNLLPSAKIDICKQVSVFITFIKPIKVSLGLSQSQHTQHNLTLGVALEWC